VKKKFEGIPLVKWKNIAKPREEVGWGLKNINYFGKPLATKSMWRVLTKEGLWKKIIGQKDLEP
jgi:hypothetical protein